MSAENPVLSVPVAQLGTDVGKPKVIVDPDQNAPLRKRFVTICDSVHTAGISKFHHIKSAGRLNQLTIPITSAVLRTNVTFYRQQA